MIITTTRKIISSEINYMLEDTIIGLTKKTISTRINYRDYIDYTGIEHNSYDPLNGYLVDQSIKNILNNELEATKEKDLYGLIKRLSEKNPSFQYRIENYNYNDLQQYIIRHCSEISADYIIVSTGISNIISLSRSFIFNSHNSSSFLCYQVGILQNISVIMNPYLSYTDTTILFGKTNEIVYIEKEKEFSRISCPEYNENIVYQYINFVNKPESSEKFRKMEAINMEEI